MEHGKSVASHEWLKLNEVNPKVVEWLWSDFGLLCWSVRVPYLAE